MSAVLPGPKTLTELRAQADLFQRQVEETEARLRSLTNDGNEFTRPPGTTNRVRTTEDELAGKRQALLNARRVLQAAESLPDYDIRVAAYYAGIASDWEGDDE